MRVPSFFNHQSWGFPRSAAPTAAAFEEDELLWIEEAEAGPIVLGLYVEERWGHFKDLEPSIVSIKPISDYPCLMSNKNLYVYLCFKLGYD
jgi:hypothetical protein